MDASPPPTVTLIITKATDGESCTIQCTLVKQQVQLNIFHIGLTVRCVLGEVLVVWRDYPHGEIIVVYNNLCYVNKMNKDYLKSPGMHIFFKTPAHAYHLDRILHL